MADRLREQQRRIEAAARAAGREPGDVQLIAVSKRHSVEAIVEAYAAGQRDFGENYVQELLQKAEALRAYSDIRWHLIGHLQSNKARFVTGLVQRIHTVDSAKLVRELAKRMRQNSVTTQSEASGPAERVLAERDSPGGQSPLGVLVEVNLSGESNKSGCSEAELAEVVSAVEAESHLELRGLMTIPAWSEDPEAARPVFERLRDLREELGGARRLPELSMGMSHDAEVAISAGATSVRIGTAIFGPRPER